MYIELTRLTIQLYLLAIFRQTLYSPTVSQSLLSFVNVIKFLILLAKQQRPTKPAAATASSSSPRPGQNPPPEQVKNVFRNWNKKKKGFTIHSHSPCALLLPPVIFFPLHFLSFSRNIRCVLFFFYFTFLILTLRFDFSFPRCTLYTYV